MTKPRPAPLSYRPDPALHEAVPITALCHAGVIQRHGTRPATLRVHPRFLAHAEATSNQMGSHGRALGLAEVLAIALGSWPGFTGDVRRAVTYLANFLSERDQLGALRPVFPPVATLTV